MKKLCLLFLTLVSVLLIFGCDIDINRPPKEEVYHISTTSLDGDIFVGDTGQIVMTSDKKNDEFEFTSSDPLVFTIDEDGNYEAVAGGEATITITSKLTEASFSKKITVQVKTIDFITTTSLDGDIYIGDGARIIVTSSKENDEYEFASSNPEIFRIDEDGNYEALAEGNVTITITSTITGAKLTKTITIKYVYPTDTLLNEAIYLGLYNFGNVTNTQMDSFQYRFFTGGKEVKYQMAKVGDYELQNRLEEGNLYYLTVSNNKITNLTKLDGVTPLSSPRVNNLVSGFVEEIDKYQIKVGGTTYLRLENVGQYKITKAAGGASVTSSTTAVGQYVILALSEHGYCQNIYQTKEIKDYQLVIEGTPGERTLTNFFKTALSAVGHALYVYGGAWDYQDVGSSNQARSIGVASSWVQFFYEQNASYSYKNTSDHSKTYYPFGSFNEYYYAGVDCSGFVGWVMYNVMNTESGHEGFVMGSNKMAKTFAEMGYGTYTRDYSTPTSNVCDFKVGDIISCQGHVWICLGVCSDGSIVIIHSTPSESYNGTSGGGAQLGAIGNSTECEAYKLADKYNKEYFVDWSSRYPTSLKSYSVYLSKGNANNGKFSWYLNSNGVLDPDGLTNKTPAEILKFLFSENE